MSTGIYTTIDPDTRIKVVFDEAYPTENPEFPYAPGVLDDLIQCYEEGDYYGVIVEKRHKWENVNPETAEVREKFEWEEEDSIWACAGYGDKVAETVAKEYFGITVTGRDEMTYRDVKDLVLNSVEQMFFIHEEDKG